MKRSVSYIDYVTGNGQVIYHNNSHSKHGADTYANTLYTSLVTTD